MDEALTAAIAAFAMVYAVASTFAPAIARGVSELFGATGFYLSMAVLYLAITIVGAALFRPASRRLKPGPRADAGWPLCYWTPMTTRPLIDNRTARAIFLDRHGLAEAPAGSGRGADLQSVIDALGFVQVDSDQHCRACPSSDPACSPAGLSAA